MPVFRPIVPSPIALTKNLTEPDVLTTNVSVDENPKYVFVSPE
jgi:hypothetical protein